MTLLERVLLVKDLADKAAESNNLTDAEWKHFNQEVFALQKLCPHSFIARQPENCDADTGQRTPERNVCLICALTESHHTELWHHWHPEASATGRWPFMGYGVAIPTWYTYLFHEDGTCDYELENLVELIQNEMVIRSLSDLEAYITKYGKGEETTKEEQRMIEFVRFCNSMAEKQEKRFSINDLKDLMK